MVRISLLMLLLVTACQSVPEKLEPPRREFDSVTSESFVREQFSVYDPAEGANKQVYKFNALADDYVLVPVVDTYQYIVPDFARQRISNFFLNIGEVGNFTNSIFQLKPAEAGITVGRFAINTTVGLVGMFDVAGEIGMERQSNDFGKTLGYYGAGSGPFVMLPLLGPSNLRDTAGFVVDFATLSLIVPNEVEDTLTYKIVAYGVQPVNTRASNNFRYFQSGSPFEYELVRYITTTARQLQIDQNNAKEVKK